jgi:phosphoadenosine phosphosulfate reductase
MPERVAELAKLLRNIAEHYSPAVLASGLGAEGMLLLDLIEREQLPIDVFTLDTGRLHQETYDLLQRAQSRYRVAITVYAPESRDIEDYVSAHGPNGFYDSAESRRACCAVRKLKPLRRALAGRRAWITGLRREQSVTRHAVSVREWDAEHQLHKFNPLAEWSNDDVWSYLRQHDVCHNALHAQGYPSIGCVPCTRAVAPGEDLRAGRWWWENASSRECGLHPHAATGE